MEKMLKILFTDKKIEYFETVNNFCDIGATLQNSQNLRKKIANFAENRFATNVQSKFIRNIEYKILSSIHIHAHLI